MTSIRFNRKTFFSSLISLIGFLLSPISWWNDLLINIPLAYIMSLPFAWIDERLFLPAMMLSYWITNIIGLLMMHHGISGFYKEIIFIDKEEVHNKKGKSSGMMWEMAWSLVYTAVMIILVMSGLISFPKNFLF
jgi:hypothetical protein